MFLCPSRRLATYLQKADQANYLYRFAGTLDAFLLPNVSGKSFHGADTPFVLGNDFPLGTIPLAEQPLTAIVQGYWVQFAATGAPGLVGTAPEHRIGWPTTRSRRTSSCCRGPSPIKR